MKKNNVIHVGGVDINVTKRDESSFISLTDIVANFGGNDQIKNWIRTRRTIEFLGTWESLENPDFNSVEYHRIVFEAGSEKFIMSPGQWIERTGAIGIISNRGSGKNGGGTFAHEDIALEFCSWLSPAFKLLVIKEFRRLKEQESSKTGEVWDIRRYISKANYTIQTDSIKENLIPIRKLPKDKEGIVYAEEAELVNLALFGTTAKEWKQDNPQLCIQGRNMRDYADTHKLIVLSNLESRNAEMIKIGHPADVRYRMLREIAITQLKTLERSKTEIDRRINSPFVAETAPSSFNQTLKGVLSVPPPQKDKKKDEQ